MAITDPAHHGVIVVERFKGGSGQRYVTHITSERFDWTRDYDEASVFYHEHFVQEAIRWAVQNTSKYMMISREPWIERKDS